MIDKPLVAITDASSGVGEATARAFSEAGCPLLLTARRLGRMEALGLPNAERRRVDGRDSAALAALAVAVRDAEARFGPVDTMFANTGIARLADYPDHTVYCGAKFFVHNVAESLREYLSAHDVRVLVLSPGVIETEALNAVTDTETPTAYRPNKPKMGGGVGSDIVSRLILDAYRLPQNALVQEICLTPTRQIH